MARVVLDPDDINQDRTFTLGDGEVVQLDQADRPTLERITKQLFIHRSAYEHAFDDPVVGDRVITGEARLEDHSPLHLRVKALLERKRERHRRPAADMDAEVLLQARVWTSSGGRTTVLLEMTPTHRRNLIGWLERNSEAIRERAEATLHADQLERVAAADPWIAGTPLHRRLAELIEAESENERAMDKARQIVRAQQFQRSGEWPDR